MSSSSGTNGSNGTSGSVNVPKKVISTSGNSGKEHLPWYKRLIRKLDKDL